MSVSYRSVSKSMLGINRYGEPYHPIHFNCFLLKIHEAITQKDLWYFDLDGDLVCDFPDLYIRLTYLFNYFQDPLYPTPEELTIFEIEFKVSYPIEARTLFKKRKNK